MAVTVQDISWAAGLLEGKGAFVIQPGGTPAIGCALGNIWPLEKLQRLFGGTIALRKNSSCTSPVHEWEVCGAPAAGAMMTLFSLMLSRRKKQITDALSAW